MAETTQKTDSERSYIIPLRDAWRNKSNYKRSRAAVQEVKRFVARHMKLQGDIERVSVDIHLNNEIWHRGSRKPPARIEVKVKRDGENVIVMLVKEPKHLEFVKARHVKRHKKIDSKKVKEPEKERTQEEKKAEEEKEKSVAIANEKLAEDNARAIKHTTKIKTPKINRMALQK
ncbi:MAG: 50S ribosomal protein L31e [Nanoarchaeota archaeon]